LFFVAIPFSPGTTERSESDEDRQDMFELLSSTANGTAPLSEETMALLNYIDYEKKRILASRGKLFLSALCLNLALMSSC
jgi:hypothetical protein